MIHICGKLRKVVLKLLFSEHIVYLAFKIRHTGFAVQIIITGGDESVSVLFRKIISKSIAFADHGHIRIKVVHILHSCRNVDTLK